MNYYLSSASIHYQCLKWSTLGLAMMILLNLLLQMIVPTREMPIIHSSDLVQRSFLLSASEDG